MLDGIQELLHVGVFLLGGIIAWIIKRQLDITTIKKQREEISKLEAEAAKFAGDNLYRMQQARNEYNDACKVCGEKAKEISLMLRDSSEDLSLIQKTRNDFGTELSHRAFPHLSSHVEWQCLQRKTNSKAMVSYIRTDVIPELERLQSWVEIMNMPVFTTKMSLSPLKIQQRTLRPFLDLVQSIPDAEAENELFTKIQQIIKT